MCMLKSIHYDVILRNFLSEHLENDEFPAPTEDGLLQPYVLNKTTGATASKYTETMQQLEQIFTPCRRKELASIQHLATLS